MSERHRYRARSRQGARFAVVGATLLSVMAAAGIAAVATAGVVARRSKPQAHAAVQTPMRLLRPGTLQTDVADPVRKPSPSLPVHPPEPVARLRPTSLRIGAEGPEVTALQRRLDELGYVITVIDGRFGEQTHHALVAFQKVNGLSRDGILGPATSKALARPKPLQPQSKSDGFHVEVDLSRQVLFLVEDGRVTEIYDTSTGSGQPYEVDGDVRIARTPLGTFAIERKIDGWRESALGTLYRPAYFYGGYAIHGNSSVPPYPASHGCVRVTNQVMDGLFDRLEYGTPVLVY